MALYSLNNQYPAPLPFRIVLPNGFTRTDPSTFTEEEIASVGYAAVPDKPIAGDNQIVGWSIETGTWSIYTKTEEDLAQEAAEQLANDIASAREARNEKLAACDWTQLSDAPVDAAAWAAYRQALRDLPSQEGFPYTVVWPTQPE